MAACTHVDPMRVFGQLRALDVRSLAGPVFEIEVPAGTELVREGEPIGTFFVIRDGAAEESRLGRAIRSLSPGDCFGEADACTGEAQAFSVIATSRLRLLAFSSLGIGQLCAAIPGARERIEASLGSLVAV
jgi:CRP-like cAMP-binding protein